jgi:sterol desaturase/sphingolipid hydroxylase (fatty acid hydroxylase superfamily)
MIFKIIFLAFGILFWTFLEYLIHRFLGHQNNAKHIIRQEHKRHHAEWDYFVPLHKKLFVAALFLAISTTIMSLFFSFSYALFFAIGLAGMYLIYESAHKLFHAKEPLIGYGLKMRKHHFYHHFGNPKLNHGVTTAFWDRVFGTFKSVDAVSVPKNMAMRWLFDAQHHIKQKYSQHFSLK